VLGILRYFSPGDAIDCRLSVGRGFGGGGNRQFRLLNIQTNDNDISFTIFLPELQEDCVFWGDFFSLPPSELIPSRWAFCRAGIIFPGAFA
jgi:hypothetical protein